MFIGQQQRGHATVLWLAAAVGSLIGFFVGRGSVSQSKAVIALSEALAAQYRASAAAPIIAVGITAASAIICGCLCCLVVWWIIHRTETQEARHNDKQ